MMIIRVLLAGAMAFNLLADVSEAACTQARVRRNWDSMSSSDKQLYKDALASAMDSGEYIKFVEMHTEVQSELEAHQQCMFTYWHRFFLIAFENMLRGQGSAFECITLPYWDWITAQNRLTLGQCTSLGDCSALPQELGGWTGSTQSLTINNKATNGRCVSQYPLNHFCQSSGISGNQCSKCLTRGNWGSAAVPGSTSYSSVLSQVFSGNSIGEMSPSIEQGCHNNVHANLGGAMGTLASPADPIFYSHHAMVDLMQVIFYKCKSGTEKLTFEQKAANTVGWTSCQRRNGGTFSPTDEILMRTGMNGNNPINGWSDSVIGKYFPSDHRFASLMDVTDLGDNSYTYELNGFLATMYESCNGVATPTSSPSATPSPSSFTPTSSVSTPTITSPSNTPVTSSLITQTPLTAMPTQLVTSAPVATSSPSWLNNRRNRWWNWWRNRGWRRLQESTDSITVNCESGFDENSDYPASTPDKTLPTAVDSEHEYASTPVASDDTDYVEPASTPLSTDQRPASSQPVSTPAITDDTSVPIEPVITPVSTEMISGPAMTPASTEYTPSFSPSSQLSSYTTEETPVVPSVVITSYEETEPANIAVLEWYQDMLETVASLSTEPLVELERMSCVFQDVCLGGEPGYTKETQEMFGQRAPRCKLILESLADGSSTICYPDWLDQTIQKFGCPVPPSFDSSSITYNDEGSNNETLQVDNAGIYVGNPAENATGSTVGSNLENYAGSEEESFAAPTNNSSLNSTLY